MLSKKHYEAIAGIVNGLPIAQPTYPRDPAILLRSYRHELVEHLAAYFSDDNPRFDRERFITACESSVNSAERQHQTGTTTR